MNDYTVTIKNEYLTVGISTLGAELQSIKTMDETEHLYQGDMIFHKEKAPIYFPICGKLWNKKYIYNGKAFMIPTNGFALDAHFNIMELTEDMAVFSLLSSEETKKMYPFDFELLITYKLLGKSIDCSYEIINDTKDTIYFSIGAAESYDCPEGISNYCMIFETEEENPIDAESGICCQINEATSAKQFDLSDSLFTKGMLLFQNIKSNYVLLKNNKNHSCIRIETEEFPNLLLSSKPGAQYVCLAPWCGAISASSNSEELSNLPFIESLEECGHFEKHHIITVNKD